MLFKAWAMITSHFEWTGQTFCFHSPQFEVMFTRAMQSCSITLPLGFYERLYETIANKVHALSTVSTVELFKDCFTQNHHDKIIAVR